MSEEPKAYKTAGAFRAALDARLQNRARGRYGPSATAAARGFRSLLGAFVLKRPEGRLSMDVERRLRDGVADAHRADHERHRPNAAL